MCFDVQICWCFSVCCWHLSSLYGTFPSDHDVCISTAGIHPHCAEQMRDDSLSTIEDLLQKPECVGMGEIGLDYNRNFSPKDKQKEVFEKQVRAGGARC